MPSGASGRRLAGTPRAMIVILTESGYDVIFQPAHGLLAAKIAQHWRLDERPRHWLELLTAIAQHDNNQRDFRGGNRRTEAGAPRGFTVSSGESEVSDLEQPRATLEDAFYQGRYVALMVSQHVSTLYEPRRGASEELDALLDEQRADQKRWRKELGLTKAETERAYRLMLWCDRCSLILCQDLVPEAGRRLEVQMTPEGEPSFIREGEDGVVHIDPWPFEEEGFREGVEVRRLEQIAFASDEELHEALRVSPVEVRSWEFRRS